MKAESQKLWVFVDFISSGRSKFCIKKNKLFVHNLISSYRKERLPKCKNLSHNNF